MSNLLRKASMLTGMVIASGSMMLAAAPSYAGNEIQMEAVADVIPACDILGQTVGRLVESVPGDGDAAFTRGRLISAPAQDDTDGFANGAALGQLAYVGLSCTAGDSTIATVTSPVQISGTDLDINVATTRMYAPSEATPAANVITSNMTTLNTAFANANPVASVSSGPDGAVATSDAAVILGEGSALATGDTTGTFGFGFQIEVNGARIPAGQYGIASTLTVVPR
ncbi:hypothetical protein [Anabaenopsis arnoldii]|uniref:WxL domain-containing protein n=1 Tax=Anabaenopsis arnoldii TaxID=2152938 RepID=A0ABT5ATK6_9CYAN|nr:hypothetical protein [Anabaenopsis arnoldii]MDB9540642.1 hypothetical protein [Anabaenopsis arnoldii]MDH6093080.1 hypothetical protein [Anabaenopsis arnoldii]